MPNAISAHYTDAKLPAGCPVDDKIDVFEDWMNGWLLLHAHALFDEAYRFRKDAGFAILMLTRLSHLKGIRADKCNGMSEG